MNMYPSFEERFDLSVEDFIALPVDRRALLLLAHGVKEQSAYNFMLSLKGAGLPHRSAGMVAAAEAWQWLNTHGLVVPDHQDTHSASYVVTPRGHEAIEDPDGFLADQSARRRLDVNLSDELTSARTMFLIGEYEMAAFTAMKAVEVAVRDQAGLPNELYGPKLMSGALGPNGPLASKGLTENEQNGRVALYSGAMGILRNPPAHRVVDYDDPTEAAEVVLFADLLLRMLRRL